MFWRKKIQEVEDPITTKLKNNGSIVLLDGDWGVGKTYRFQKTIKKQLENSGYNVKYLSLFGLKNTEQIRSEFYNFYIRQKQYYSILSICALAMIVLFVCATLKISPDIIKFFGNITGIGLLILCNIILIPLILSKVHIIIQHLLNKYLGINHNTLPVKTLFKKKTIFCFDDIERISENASVDEFLGFINTLAKTDGFSILVISCYNKCLELDERKRLMTLYKEKVFDYQIKDEISDTKIKDVFAEHFSIDQNTDLLEYLQNIYKKFQEKEITIGTNLRTLQKLCQNLVTINNAIGGFDRLKQNYMESTSIWAYIAYLTLAKDRNEQILYQDSLSTTYSNDEKTETEKIEDILLENVKNTLLPIKYKSIYDALIYGKTNQEQLKKELLPFEYGDYTEFEKKYLPLRKTKEPFHLEHKERNKIKQQMEKNLTPKKQLFSSIPHMREILFFYLKCYQCTETCLDTKLYQKIKNIIRTNIKAYSIEELQNAISDDTWNLPDNNTPCSEQQKEIFDFIKECCIQELTEKFKNNCWETKLNSNNPYWRSIATLSISFYPENLLKIYQTDFQRFKNITHRIYLYNNFMQNFLNYYQNIFWSDKYKELLNTIMKKFTEKLRELPQEEKLEKQEVEKYIREFHAYLTQAD